MSPAVKDRVCAAVDARADDLIARSHAIHERPELGFEEYFASALIADALAECGFAVERNAYGIDTAFIGRIGDPAGVHVVICCEYDALPAIGHGCGHNIIAAAGLGAALALAPHIATTHLKIEMEGKAAHAAAAPWEGVNALDAIVLGYTGVAALRLSGYSRVA